MNSDVFYALLAMDSYDRVKNDTPAGLKVTGNIGNAVVGASYAIFGDGFFAQAYTWQGKTVIAYRGTDSIFGIDIPSDVLTGWTTGVGAYSSAQAKDAVEFYKQLNGGLASSNPDIVLTGHSLGGGLAGFVAGIYGGQAEVFDNMPFELAAGGLYNATRSYEHFDQQGLSLGTYADDLEAKQFYFGNAEPSQPNFSDPSAPNFANVSGYFVEGEILEALRAFQTNYVEGISDSSLNQFGSLTLHSQALLTILLYSLPESDTNVDSNWLAFAPSLLPVLFNENVANMLGIHTNDETGTDDASTKLMKMIAYSAIDEGAKPYGDTGIRALFDDAADIGKMLSHEGTVESLKDLSVQYSLAEIAVEYAGLLAVNAETGRAASGDVTGFEKGAFYYADGKLIGDFSETIWKDSSGNEVNVLGKSDLISSLVDLDAGAAFTVESAISQIWAGDTDHLVKLVVATESLPAVIDAYVDAQIDLNSNDGAFLVGSDQDDLISGARANDLLIGGAGEDTLIGGRGDDLLFGGSGDDTFKGFNSSSPAPSSDPQSTGQEGNDWLDGGSGLDTVDYSSSQNAVVVDATINNSFANSSEVDDGTGGRDTLISVEKLKLTSHNDILKVDEGNTSGLRSIREIDAGDQDGGDGDVIDISAVGKLFKMVGTHVSGMDLELKNFETVLGGDGNDKINLIDTGIKNINAGGGVDYVTSNDQLATIDLGAGNDYLVTAGQGTIVYGGLGNDHFELNNNILIADADEFDVVTYAGNTVTGGVRWGGSESIWAEGRYGLRYAVDTDGELVIRDTQDHDTYIANFDADTDPTYRTAGIYVVQISIEAYQLIKAPNGARIFETWEALMCKAMVALTGHSYFGSATDPLVLDLDGDGIELSPRMTDSARFDLDGDGFAEASGEPQLFLYYLTLLGLNRHLSRFMSSSPFVSDPISVDVNRYIKRCYPQLNTIAVHDLQLDLRQHLHEVGAIQKHLEYTPPQ